MGLSWSWCGVLLYLPLFLIHFPFLVKSIPEGYYLTANPSISWTNNPSYPYSSNFADGSLVRFILFSANSELAGPSFACGFFCDQTCDTYLFAIFFYYDSDKHPPRVVWSANQNNPVKDGATLELTSAGGLVLRDDDGSTAWSTNISGKSVAGLNFTDMGNLVLLDENNATIWQSFDHPTDSLLLGQKLKAGQKLTSVTSAIKGPSLSPSFSFSVTREGSFAFVESYPPQAYVTIQGLYSLNEYNVSLSYAKYLNGSLTFFTLQDEFPTYWLRLNISQALSVQYMRLESNGHLRVYQWDKILRWTEVGDLLTPYIGNNGYPMVCGNYGIYTNGQCSCPPKLTDETSYFKQTNDWLPDRGCSLITPLSCNASQNHKLLELKSVKYSTFNNDLSNVDSESCKQACLNNCSCKAAIFRNNYQSFFVGDCYLLTQKFSLESVGIDSVVYYTTYIKVQNVQQNVQDAVPLQKQTNRTKKTNRVAVILGSNLALLFGMFLFIGIFVLLYIFWKKKDADEAEEHFLDQVPGMPNRYSYEDLKAVTQNFNILLGGGGFGSVFEGTLTDGTKVAVKRLDGFGQIKKSFLAEVESIGSIHHFNLVRLIGFCAEKSHRLLVYEYMCNGSLDKWIFHKTNECTLDWRQRKKIIADTAKGLAYLHEDCRQKIVHLDVKPGNVLLDDYFNAKVSDFGLSKLIDRDQSQVVTTMRGTPGYLAPEWLSSVITEKVDVYSFGVMTLEILCGRRNFESTQPEEAMHLLSLYKIKLEEEQLLDLVDKRIENVQLHGEEIMQMMKVAAWCIQSDFARRPSMSVVVKVLEGIMDVEDNLDYNFSSRPLQNTKARVLQQEVNLAGSIPPLPSVLSAPR